MNKFLAVLVLVIGFTFSAFGSDDDDPGCPPDQDISESQREQIEQMLNEGKTVIKCIDGQCWDIVTGEDRDYQGGQAKNGYYAIILAPTMELKLSQ